MANPLQNNGDSPKTLANPLKTMANSLKTMANAHENNCIPL